MEHLFSSVVLSLATVGNFGAYALVGLVMLAVVTAIYVAITPYNEFELIKSGNVAAAVSLAGTMIGLSLPLANVIAHSQSLVDVVVWALVGLCVQLAAWFTVNFVLGNLQAKIPQGSLSHGVMLAGASIAVGLINAACMTY